ANINSGAKSSLAGAFHAIFLLIMYFALMGVIKFIPLCALSAVLINVSINICNPKLFARLTVFGKRDFIILYVTMLLTVFFDLTYGVLGGFVVAILLNVKNLKLSIKTVKNAENSILNFEIYGSLYFFSVNKVISEIKGNLNGVNKVVINMQNVKNIDLTALQKLSTTYGELSSQGVELDIQNASESIKNRLDKYFLKV
ncbi:MAG: SulP family inorganic anion transporter, partial [Clostridia bacterium]|nr:SulP family inorganic anion transporter [Clostridia bacterium]